MKKLFVGNFSFATTEADLRQWFSAHGLVENVTLVTDCDTGRSRGFGFVEMPNSGEAEAAITHLNGKDAGGRALTVNEARPKSERKTTSFGGRNNSGRSNNGRDDYRGHARQPREPRW